MLQFLPEIESDMSVFHRVDDIYTMEAATMIRRVSCLAAYDGAVAAQAARQRREAAQQPQVSNGTPATAPVDDEEAMWAAYRQQRYAKFLKPGERPREVSVAEGMSIAAKAFQGVN